jgi:hypothetical protein
MRVGHLRLHDPEGARFRIRDAKTERGVAEVQMSPDLVEAVVEHLDNHWVAVREARSRRP